MVGANMPAAEIEVTLDLVEGLLANQRPALAGLPLEVMGNGWDNYSVLIGDSLVGRFPRRRASAELIQNEARWLPIIGPSLPLPVPVPLFVGEPAPGYPWPWSIAKLLPGSPANEVEDLDYGICADQIGRFLGALHVTAPRDAPTNAYRGVPLLQRDTTFRERLSELDPILDVGLAVTIWESALEARPFADDPVWIHGDLQPHNLLALGRRLSAVVDFGDVTSGDPATDLAVVWSLLVNDARAHFWSAYGTHDEALLQRARGWALNLGTAMLANSADNPALFAVGRRTVDAVLAGD